MGNCKIVVLLGLLCVMVLMLYVPACAGDKPAPDDPWRALINKDKLNGVEMTEQANKCRLIQKLEKGQQVTIVVLGDSNTELTFHTRGHLNWPYLLQEALFEKYGPNKVIMINVAKCGTGADDGLQRLDRDVLRFDPDLVIICYWCGKFDEIKQIITKVRQHNNAEVLLRTPNPVIAVNMPPVTPKVIPGKEWPTWSNAELAQKIVALGKEMDVIVVDHYKSWMAAADIPYAGLPVTNPNKLWMRMSDSMHPGALGHLEFYRDLAPYFGLPDKLSWE